MSRLFAAELLKLMTLRFTWGIWLVGLLFAGLVTAGNIGGTSVGDRLDPEFQFRILLDGALPASILALLMGIVLVTNEFRHGTIARSLLATPRRPRFVAVKLMAGAAVGAALMLGMLVVIVVTAVIWLGLLDVPLAFGDGLDGFGRAVLVATLAGIFGAAIGAAVHSQVAALVGALVWMFVLEPICWVILGLLDLDGVAEYLPAASLGGTVDSAGEGLSWARSVGMTIAWAGVATVLAVVRTNRRDIT